MEISQKLLTLQQVIDIVGQSKSTIYRGIGAGTFPKPLRLGSRMVRWLSDDIHTYISHLTYGV